LKRLLVFLKRLFRLLQVRAADQEAENRSWESRADKRREQVAMAKAEFESHFDRLLRILEDPRPDQEAGDRMREWKAMTVEDPLLGLCKS
jgi:hypothetical protein